MNLSASTVKSKVTCRVTVLLAATALCVTSFTLSPTGARADNPSEPDTYEVDTPIRMAPAESGRIVLHGTGSSKTAVDGTQTDGAATDLRRTAEGTERSLAELEEEQRLLPAFEALTASLSTTDPDSFVTSGLRRDDGKVVYWLHLAKSPSSEFTEAVKASPVDVEITYGLGADEKDLEKASEAWSTTVSSRKDAILFVRSFYDANAQKLRLEYSPTATATSDAVNAALDAGFAAAARSQADSHLPIDVTLRQVAPQVIPEQVVVQGGRNMDGGAGCTAGFTVARNDNRGVTTANHCGNSLYNGLANVINPAAVQPDTPAHDVQYHRTLTGNGHTTNNQFRATSTEDRVPTLVQNAPAGTSICHWGRATQDTNPCGLVSQTNQCIAMVGGTRCGIDSVSGARCSGGDSGGPWFYSTIARGTHVAGLDWTCYFIRIGKVQNALSVTVLQ